MKSLIIIKKSLLLSKMFLPLNMILNKKKTTTIFFMLKYICFLVFVLVNVLYASQSSSDGFKFPQNYSCEFSELIMKDNGIYETVIGSSFVSASQKLVSVELSARIDGHSFNGEIIQDFENRVMYIIDHDEKDECTAQPLQLTGEVIFDLFNGMNYTETVTVGSEPIDKYSYNYSKHPIMAEITVERATSYPVSVSYFDISEGEPSPKLLFTDSFFDFKSSSSLFEIPSQCSPENRSNEVINHYKKIPVIVQDVLTVKYDFK
eukprot:TRINITY_DN88629_c0_g1_i1.p1 TRINITY_DN88629_c0_g1~~TRINITY_DN88629_c0_g1_i1.p1  ORF type:complete len:262 (-),score=15.26 TRINITY_DN88629_c0_g1_i1:140-925(-)